MSMPSVYNRFLIFLVMWFAHSTHASIFILSKSPDIQSLSSLDQQTLCHVAKSTLAYQSIVEGDHAWQEKPILPPEVSTKKVKETLSYLCQLVNKGEGSKLLERNFLLENFSFYRWQPDIQTALEIARKSTNKRKSEMLRAIPSDKLFLTKYYTKRLKASAVKTDQFPFALYQLPFDEVGLSPELAEAKKNQLTRFKYTRQQVIEGALEKNQLAKPLIWLTEAGLHDVLLQGTGVLEVDGKLRFFNVHRNNGIAYDYAIGKTEQARYWYFAEVDGIKGYGKTIDNKIDLKPRVAFAGNVAQLGIGKLFLITFNEEQINQSHLGILADEGGAFDNNLFQLDWLVESYFGWHDYHQENKHYPDYANVYLMIKK